MPSPGNTSIFTCYLAVQKTLAAKAAKIAKEKQFQQK